MSYLEIEENLEELFSDDEDASPEGKKLIAAGNQGSGFFLKLRPDKVLMTNEAKESIVRRNGKAYRISSSLYSKRTLSSQERPVGSMNT